jgi:hypothetical protein
MQTASLLADLTLGAVCAALLAVVLGSVELGFRLGQHRARKHEGLRQTSVGTLVAATMGLLSFMLAFTFGQVWSRFDTRRVLVLKEANAIRTAYLRTDLLAEPQRAESRALLREYVGVRVNGTREDRLGAALSRSEQIHERLWEIAAAFAKENGGSVGGLFAQSVNEIIALHFERERAGLYNSISTAILGTLFFLAVLAMTSMGYHVGIAGERATLVMFALALAFSSVMFLIYDLDRPHEGFLRTSQRDLIELGRKMEAP